jgi:regulator of chromosome condensation
VYGFGKAKYSRYGMEADSLVPVLIPYVDNIRDASCGYWHTILLDSEGRAWAAGYNRHGQIGVGNTDNVDRFVQVFEGAKSIAAGGHVTLIIDNEDRLHSCGMGTKNGFKNTKLAFTRVKLEENVRYISSGMVHSSCITLEGKLYTWGDNTWGQLGLNNYTSSSHPQLVPSLSSFNILQSSCSKGEKYASTACITSDHQVFMFGSAYKGKLGIWPSWSHGCPETVAIPTPIPDFTAELVECGGIHNCAVSDGRLYTWGCGSDGRLGHPEFEGHKFLYKEPTPKLVEGLGRFRVQSISSSYYHVLVNVVNNI